MWAETNFVKTIGEYREQIRGELKKLHLSDVVISDFNRGVLHCTEFNKSLIENSIEDCLSSNSYERCLTESELNILESAGFIPNEIQLINENESRVRGKYRSELPFYALISPEKMMYVFAMDYDSSLGRFYSGNDEEIHGSDFYKWAISVLEINKEQSQKNFLNARTIVFLSKDDKLIFIA